MQRHPHFQFIFQCSISRPNALHPLFSLLPSSSLSFPTLPSPHSPLPGAAFHPPLPAESLPSPQGNSPIFSVGRLQAAINSWCASVLIWKRGLWGFIPDSLCKAHTLPALQTERTSHRLAWTESSSGLAGGWSGFGGRGCSLTVKYFIPLPLPSFSSCITSQTLSSLLRFTRALLTERKLRGFYCMHY